MVECVVIRAVRTSCDSCDAGQTAHEGDIEDKGKPPYDVNNIVVILTTWAAYGLQGGQSTETVKQMRCAYRKEPNGDL